MEIADLLFIYMPWGVKHYMSVRPTPNRAKIDGSHFPQELAGMVVKYREIALQTHELL